MNIFFQRSPRMKQSISRMVVEINEPPRKPMPPSFSYITLIIPLVMTVGTVSLYYYMSTQSKFMNPMWMMFMMFSSFMMAVSYIIPFFAHLGNKRKYKKQLLEREKIYRDTLKQHWQELEMYTYREASLLREWNPTPEECMKRIQDRASTLWERSSFDPDFLSVRLGIGNLPSSIEVIPPKQDAYEQEPLIDEAIQLEREFKTLSDVPVLLPLSNAHVVGVIGDRTATLDAMRHLVLQLVTHHSPDEVKIVSFYSEETAHEWDWMRWLPHVWDDQRKMRFLAKNRGQAREVVDYLYELLNRRTRNKQDGTFSEAQLPYWVFLISDPYLIEDEVILPLILKEAEKLGVRTLFMADSKEKLPMQCRAILEIYQGKGVMRETNYLQKEGELRGEYWFRPDGISIEFADKAARALAPVRLKVNKSHEIPNLLTLFDLFRVQEIGEIDVKERWKQNRFPNTLPVPVGMGAAGKKSILNIHDKIERKGHGPHGLIAGTTGSGKSEVIQALVAALAVNYHPHDIVFLLIDYKGGGMSNTFENLPHLVGSITNLDGNLIERAKVSLRAELMRREKVLKEAGNLQHIDEYNKSHLSNENPLPHLVIIIDEFAELKKEQPDFMNELISIAAKGRTLGVHLILATQKPSGVVDDKIWSNSRFRICLRVQDEADSKEMIKIPDAAWITTPGRGYFQVGSNEILEMVQFAWSGAPYRPGQQQTQEVFIREVTLTGRLVPRTERIAVKKSDEGGRRKKQLDVLVDYLAEEAENMGIKPLDGPWLPPLPKQLSLEEVRGPNRRGWDGEGWKPTDTWLEAVVGMFDDPYNQNQEPLKIALDEGHLVIYGMPATGKTTFVQTLLMTLALDHSPDDVHMYILDFGHMFRDLTDLPHMGSIIKDDEPDRVKRLFRYLTKEMLDRREKISQSGAKTFASYRKSLKDPIPVILVVIDGYVTFKSTFEEENEQLEQLLRQGISFGIHFIVTTNQITDMYDRVRNNFSLSVAFELADPTDYTFAVGRLKTPPVNLPEGRGFVKGQVPPLEFQTALPSDGEDEIERANTLREKVQAINATWDGERPKSIDPMPEEITLEELLEKHHQDPNVPQLEPLQVPVGISMEDLTPFYVSLKDGPYFVVGTPIEGGKTSFLQTWILSLATFHSPEQLQVYAIDFRASARGLSSIMGIPHMKGYASDETELTELLQNLEPILEQRVKVKASLRAQDAAQQGSNDPAILLVIDDADYFAKRMSSNYDLQNTLTRIVSQGRNKNFYVVIAGSPSHFPYSSNDWLSEVKGMETGFLFSSLDPNDLSFFKIPSSEGRSYSGAQKSIRIGEGYFAKRRYEKVKAAKPFSQALTSMEWENRLCERWPVAEDTPDSHSEESDSHIEETEDV